MDVYFEEIGPVDGPPVVLVHGMGDNRSTWRLLVPGLVAAGHRVVAMDVRGYGRSSAQWPTYRHEAVGADLLELIDHIGRPAFVVAHSIGCAAAVEAAVRAPEKVSGLVLIGTFSGDSPVKAWMRAAAWLVARSPALWGMFYKSLYVAGRPADFDENLKALRANLREPGRMAALRAQIGESLGGVKARYPEVTCPVLVLTGSKDPDMADPRAEARAVAAKTPHATVELLDGVGHYPHLERPEQTTAAVLRFMATARV